MAKINTTPFAQTVNNTTAVVTAAIASITTDAPTGVVLLTTAGTEGAIVTAIEAMPRAPVTANALYLFTSTDGGTTKRLIDSVLMAAYTYATTTAIPQTVFTAYTEDYPLRLGANEQLYVGMGVALASGVVFEARRMDF
jgi:hypothetical protein